jgi:protein-S-isoprenylcysteine O-methyltransferase Ste14
MRPQLPARNFPHLAERVHTHEMTHRIISALLGALATLSGVVASGYAIGVSSIEELTRSDVPMWERILGVVVLWGLTIGAFYMAFRLFRFAFVERKSK